MATCSTSIERLAAALKEADAVIIGAGSGLSTAAGFTYSGERFEQYFSDFRARYGFTDMYSGGFYPFPKEEIFWAFWSRSIWVNRYQKATKPVYEKLYSLVKEKDYFILTTNVDHCFQKAGFEKNRLFYTQGDYGLFQCSIPCSLETYENEEIIRGMLLAQGYVIKKDHSIIVPEGVTRRMEIPAELLPRCPHCNHPLTTNLRCDESFVEDEGWHQAAKRYTEFVSTHEKKKVLFLELGVGYNTPGIIKFPFWKMTAENRKAIYASLNKGEADCPSEIEKQSVCINGDIAEIIQDLLQRRK